MRSLSELPGDIIQHIVNLMRPTEKEAFQLSLLSKDFSSAVQNSNRILVFDGFGNREGFSDISSVTDTLYRYSEKNINLEMFEFKIRYLNRSYAFMIKICINLATELSPKKLNLGLLQDCGPGDLPQSVFGVKSVVQLSVEDCKLKPVVNIQWPNLKELRLESVFMEDGVFENMMRSSPLLEILHIKSCFDFSLDFKHCCQNLRVLSLNKVDPGYNFFIDFERKFPRLEELSIGIYGSLERMNISSKSLKIIELLKIYALQEAHFDVPNIVRNGFEGIIKAISSGIKIECDPNIDTARSSISDSRFQCFPIADQFPELLLIGDVKNGVFTLTYVSES